jgi:4-hydroxy-tetrahydrodipicolinate reductase
VTPGPSQSGDGEPEARPIGVSTRSGARSVAVRGEGVEKGTTMAIRVGIAGIRGRMGHEVAALAARDPDVVLVGGISRRPETANAGAVPTVRDPAALLPEIDVLVDFTAPDATPTLADACAVAGVAFVSGTTGLDASQDEMVRAAARRIPVFRAANMSPGVNALIAALPGLVQALAGYDIEIVEAHHRYKVDAPSGTALALARAAAGANGAPLAERARFGREGVSPRTPEEIGIHAVRAGGNPGEHTVILASDGEEIRLAHRSFSRAAYAQGALRAARLLVSQPPGWYEPATLPGFV